MGLKQARDFQGPAGGIFQGKVVEETKCGDREAVVVEVSGKGYYSGTATFTCERDDPLRGGFLLK